MPLALLIISYRFPIILGNARLLYEESPLSNIRIIANIIVYRNAIRLQIVVAIKLIFWTELERMTSNNIQDKPY